MRRGFGWIVAIVAALVLLGVGIGAYNLGVAEGIERAADGVEVVRHVGGYGFGFFPFFPFFLFIPLVFLLVFAFRGPWAAHRWGRDHEHPHGPGGMGSHGPWERGFEDWHRRQHQDQPGSVGAGEEPAG